MNHAKTTTGENLLIIGASTIFGVLLVLPAISLETSISNAFSWEDMQVWTPFIEEALKMFAVILLYSIFNRRINPFIIAFIVATGFAIFETYLYTLYWTNFEYTFFRLPYLALHIVATLLSTVAIVKCEKEGYWHILWAIPLFWLFSSILHLCFNIVAVHSWFLV